MAPQEIEVKAREFWITLEKRGGESGAYYPPIVSDSSLGKSSIHVIEYSAYLKERERNLRLVKALENIKNAPEQAQDAYGSFKIMIREARRALEAEKEVKP